MTRYHYYILGFLTTLLNLRGFVTQSITCDPQFPFRSSNGTCNNLGNPLWGSIKIPLVRYLPSQYEDGISVVKGEGRTPPLPSSRNVSVAISRAPPVQSSSQISLMVMQWGQFIDHDMASTPEFEVEECCQDSGNFEFVANSECRALDVRGDEFYKQFNVECLRVVRSRGAMNTGTSGNPREQLDSVTSYLDGSQVYGSSQTEQNTLRTFNGGEMKIGPENEILRSSCQAACPFNFLPMRTNALGQEMLFAGDRRVQEQPALTSIHTLFLRVHNNFARQLKTSRPDSTDEQIFQEVRRIVSALIQQITYSEFLPQVIGTGAVEAFGLTLNSPADVYDNSVDATVANVFATASFRFGHSLIKDVFMLRDTNVLLRESFNRHTVTLAQGSYPSDFMEGLSFDTSASMDHFLAETVTNKLFAQGPQFDHGSDLYARNIFRGRDHGLPPYNEWRKFCDLPEIKDLSDLASVMPIATAEAFQSVYSSVNDIDIFPALISESPAQGSESGIAGPTLTCLLGRHFRNTKVGDRFWFERQGQPKPFTPEQLQAIRQTTLSSLICMYTDTPEIARQAMVVNGTANMPEPCSAVLANTVPKVIGTLF